MAQRDRRRNPSDRGSITQKEEEMEEEEEEVVVARLCRSVVPASRARWRITDLFRAAICVDYPFRLP